MTTSSANSVSRSADSCFFFFFQAEDGIRDLTVTGVQTCALPISDGPVVRRSTARVLPVDPEGRVLLLHGWDRSEEHTSELQSQSNLVCRLLLEKKKKKKQNLLLKYSINVHHRRQPSSQQHHHQQH